MEAPLFGLQQNRSSRGRDRDPPKTKRGPPRAAQRKPATRCHFLRRTRSNGSLHSDLRSPTADCGLPGIGPSCSEIRPAPRSQYQQSSSHNGDPPLHVDSAHPHMESAHALREVCISVYKRRRWQTGGKIHSSRPRTVTPPHLPRGNPAQQLTRHASHCPSTRRVLFREPLSGGTGRIWTRWDLGRSHGGSSFDL